MMSLINNEDKGEYDVELNIRVIFYQEKILVRLFILLFYYYTLNFKSYFFS